MMLCTDECDECGAISTVLHFIYLYDGTEVSLCERCRARVEQCEICYQNTLGYDAAVKGGYVVCRACFDEISEDEEEQYEAGKDY